MPYEGFELDEIGLDDAVSSALTVAGVKFRARERDGHMVVQCMLPTKPTPIIIEARAALPGDEVGAIFGKNGSFRKAAKAVAKKVAKSKVLKKIGKLAPILANLIPPPAGQIISVAATAATVATKLAKAAKAGHAGAKKLLEKGKAVNKLADKVHSVKVAQSAAKKVKAARARAPAGTPGGLYTVAFPDGSRKQVRL